MIGIEAVLGQEVKFRLEAFGHQNIIATHPSTIEFTKDDKLTVNGDCIVGIKASHGLPDLPREMRELFMTDSGRARLELTMGDETFEVEGRGASGLTLTHPTEMVVRKSNFLSDRTLMVRANRAARDLPRSFVNRLTDPSQKVLIEILAWDQC